MLNTCAHFVVNELLFWVICLMLILSRRHTIVKPNNINILDFYCCRNICWCCRWWCLPPLLPSAYVFLECNVNCSSQKSMSGCLQSCHVKFDERWDKKKKTNQSLRNIFRSRRIVDCQLENNNSNYAFPEYVCVFSRYSFVLEAIALQFSIWVSTLVAWHCVSD